MKKLKQFLLVLTVIITFFAGSPFVLAEEENAENKNTEEKSKEEQSTNSLQNEDEIFTKTYGSYKDQSVYYNIDYMDLTELEEEGFFDKFMVFSNVKDGAVGVIYNLLHEVFVAFPFFALKILTASLIFLLGMVYEVNFVNAIVDEISTYIQSVAGINGMGFGTTGLFGGLIGIISLTIALYTAYQLIVQKASITAFSGLLKSLVALVVALVFFSNYAPIIKGLNSLSVETAGLILSGGASVEKGVIDDKTARERMTEEIWNTFVHQPYLMLQYGTMNEQKIGSDRIESLLTAKYGTEDRYELVKEEIEAGNEMMSRGKIFEKLGILLIALFASMLNSIPILILAFALLFFQFWFTAMAMIAPFVFVWSAFPNQFKVLGRYTAELITPLILKLGVALLALIVFTLTTVLSSISIEVVNNDSVFGYIFLVFTEGILLFTLFLLRKRITNIFTFGSQELRFLRQEMSNAFVEPMKKGVQTTATLAGTAVGAAAAGPQGAMMGANIGSSLGKGLTEDQELTNTVKSVTLTSLLSNQNSSSEIKSGEINPSPTAVNTGQSSSNPSTNQSSSPESSSLGTKPSSDNTKRAATSELVNLEEVGKETDNQSELDLTSTNSNSVPIVVENRDSTPLDNIGSPQQPIPVVVNPPILEEVHTDRKEEINPDDKKFELNEVISEIDNNHKEDLPL